MNTGTFFGLSGRLHHLMKYNTTQFQSCQSWFYGKLFIYSKPVPLGNSECGSFSFAVIKGFLVIWYMYVISTLKTSCPMDSMLAVRTGGGHLCQA